MLHKKLVITQLHMDLPNVTKEPILFRGLFVNDRLEEVYCEQSKNFLPLNTIAIGRVENILPGMGGAFVRISPNELAYLPVSQQEDAIFTKRNSEHKLSIGDELIVQVCKEPLKTKGATLSANLQIAGRYMVFVTDSTEVQISKKIIGEKRKNLKMQFEQFLQQDRSYGVVVRTNGAYASLEELKQEFIELSCLMNEIIVNGRFKTLYQVLYRPESETLQRIRDFLPTESVEIVTDLPNVYDEILASGLLYENLKLRLYEDTYGLDKLYSVTKHLSECLATKVWLKSGAYLCIEPTEALTVIDVNSGKNIHPGKNKRYYLDINLEAVPEIMHQLTLRNVSGIIVVDFIDMPDKNQQQELIQCLTEECKKQRIPTSFVEMTKLNLAHIVRKKMQQSLREQVKE